MYFQHIDPDHLTGRVALAGDLLAGAQHSVRLLCALTQSHEHIAGRIHPEHAAGEHLLRLGRIAFINSAALCLTDALNDHLLGSLGGNAAKLLNVHGDRHGVAGLYIGVKVPGGIHMDLHSGVFHLFHGGLHQMHCKTFLTEIHHHIFCGDIPVILPVLAVCVSQRLLQTVHHIRNRDALQILQLTQRCKYLCTDIHLGGVLLLCPLCHNNSSLFLLLRLLKRLHGFLLFFFYFSFVFLLVLF